LLANHLKSDINPLQAIAEKALRSKGLELKKTRQQKNNQTVGNDHFALFKEECVIFYNKIYNYPHKSGI